MNSIAASCLLLLISQPLDPPPRFERLPCGLRVCVVEDRGLPLVSVQLWFRAGSVHDAPTRPGMCRLAQILLEQRDDLALRLNAMGARTENRTLRDACGFSAVLPAEQLDAALEVEAARLRPLVVDKAPLERALRSIAVPPADAADRADAADEPAVLARLVPEHPYRVPPGFAAASLAEVTPEDVQEFLERWFAPAGATLFIIGDVETEAALESVKRRFAGIAWREPARRAELPPLEAAQPRALLALPAAEPGGGADIELHWLTPARSGRRSAALDVLMHHLCNPVDGSLTARFAAAGCGPPRWSRSHWRLGGLLTLSVAAPGQAVLQAASETPAEDQPPGASTPVSAAPEQVEPLVLAALAAAAEAVLPEIALDRARNLAEQTVMEGRGSFADRALALAEAEMVSGDILLHEIEVPRISRLTVADVQEAARRLLAGGRIAVRRARASHALESADVAGVAPLAVARRPDCLTASERLARLSRIPVPAIRERALPVTTPHVPHSAGARLRAVVARIGGALRVCVRVVLDEPPDATRARLARVAAALARQAELLDYLTYHGLSCRVDQKQRDAALVLEGPEALTPQMLEIAAGLLADRDGGADEPAGAPATSARNASASATSSDRPWVRVRIRLAVGDDDAPLAARAADLIEQLLAPGDADGGAAAGYRCETRWPSRDVLEVHATLSLATYDDPARVAQIVAGDWAAALHRLQASGDATPAVGTAWRLAAVQRRIRLDNPGAIAAAAQRYGIGPTTDRAEAELLALVLARMRESGLPAPVSFESGGLPEKAARRIAGLTNPR
ncbi:MAG TPA: insulinase family protein [Phycisphaerae bacterium]|nr:insulinase family protein [Phycisphaerae bacterium]